MALRFLFHFIVRRYYPRIEVTHRKLIPPTGPVLFVANHHNSLLDPLVLEVVIGRNVHFLAKAPLFETPILGDLMRAFGMIPAYRRQDDPTQMVKNRETLSTAVEYLRRGNAVGIFPEGRSHDAVKVERVHTGAARIAFQALQRNIQNLIIVPVGINYQSKSRFRSAIWVHVGRPISAARWFTEYPEEHQAVRTLTQELGQRLRGAVIHLDTPTWEPFLEDLELLLPALRRRSHDPLASLRARQKIARVMNAALRRGSDEVEKTAALIQAHKKSLAAEGLTFHTDLLHLHGVELLLRRAIGILQLLLGLLPAAIGFIYHIVPFFAVRGISRLIREPGKMTIALYRLMVGVPVYVGWYVLLWGIVSNYFLPWVAWSFTVLMPWCGVAALQVGRRVEQAYGLWWREILLLFKPDLIKRLSHERREVAIHLSDLVDKYSPEVQGIELNPPPPPRQLPKLLCYTALACLLGGIMLVTVAYSRRSSELGLNNPAFRPLMGLDTTPHLSDEEQLLKTVIAGVTQLEARALAINAEFLAGKRSFYRQEDDDQVRQLLFTFLSYRSELLRIIWSYREAEQFASTQLQQRAFLLSITAASALYEVSSKLVSTFAHEPQAIKKLNEAEPLWGVPPGLYTTISRNLEIVRDQPYLRNAFDLYAQTVPEYVRTGFFYVSPYQEFHSAVARAHRLFDAESGKRPSTIKAVTGDAIELLKQGAYEMQSFVSSWLGDTKVRRPNGGKPLIQPDQLEGLRKLLKPGDILVERQNWFMSRAFMPGFWAHAAIYAGTHADLRKMGLDQDPRTKAWFAQLQDDGSGIVLEAVPAGVRATTINHCLGIADSAAVLRPKLQPEQIRESLARALQHLGKEYDFNFDFFSSDKLVCTELVYRAFDHGIQFPLVNVLGRMTLPPTELVRKFAVELAAPNAQLDFVAFLDGKEERGRALESDALELARSVERPALTWFQEP